MSPTASPIPPGDDKGQATERAKQTLGFRARLYLLFALVFVLLLRFTYDTLDIVRLFFLLLVTGLLLLAAAFTYITLWRARRPPAVPDPALPIFRCKHCGAAFNDGKLKKKHEKSCVEMKL